MSSAVNRPAPPARPAAFPSRSSGVMPVFRGKVSLPPPALKVARPVDDDAEWQAALAAAKLRAEQDAAAAQAARLALEEEREWAALRARALAEEEREWAALRARAARSNSPRAQRPVFVWP